MIVPIVLAAVTALTLCGAAHAQETLIRSDLPLWSDEEELDASTKVWPKSFQGPEGFGYASPFDLGDWKLTDKPCTLPKPTECERWLRIELLGFDPGMIITRARTRALLDEGEPSVIVELGEVPAHTGLLFAFQIGARGGSQYLAVEASSGLVRHATLLNMDCVKDPVDGATIRDAHFHSMFRSRYCAVNSPEAVRALAFGALKRSAVIADMEWVGPAAPETER